MPLTGPRSNGGPSKRRREEKDDPEATRRPGQRDSANLTVNKTRKGTKGSQGCHD
jgi:hypothetical protein